MVLLMVFLTLTQIGVTPSAGSEEGPLRRTLTGCQLLNASAIARALDAWESTPVIQQTQLPQYSESERFQLSKFTKGKLEPYRTPYNCAAKFRVDFLLETNLFQLTSKQKKNQFLSEFLSKTF